MAKTAKATMETVTETKKTRWEDRADSVLARRRSRGGVPLDPATCREQAQERGVLLTSRLEAVTSGRTKYPENIIKQWEFELQAIRNGTWTPNIMRPQNKEFDKLFYSVNALGPGRAEQKDADRLDNLITDDTGN